MITCNKNFLFYVASFLLVSGILISKIFFSLPKLVTYPWMKEQLEKDFEFLKHHKFTQVQINGQNLNTPGTTRFQFINGKIYSSPIDSKDSMMVEHYNILIKFFTNLVRIPNLPNVDFLVSISDFIPDLKANFLAPVFVFAKNPQEVNSKFVPLIPDSYTIGAWKTLKGKLVKAKKQYPWDQKISKAFWRGSTTGGYYTKETFSNYARTKAVAFSFAYPELADIKFTNLPQTSEDAAEIIKKLYPLAEKRTTPEEHLAYKMQLCIDGNTSTFPGYLWRLYSNSVVLKQESENVQWFYNIFKPWEHYILVKNDMSDLKEQIEWVLSHDEQAKQIAVNASNLAEELDINHLYSYWFEALTIYAALQDFKLLEPTLPAADLIIESKKRATIFELWQEYLRLHLAKYYFWLNYKL